MFCNCICASTWAFSIFKLHWRFIWKVFRVCNPFSLWIFKRNAMKKSKKKKKQQFSGFLTQPPRTLLSLETPTFEPTPEHRYFYSFSITLVSTLVFLWVFFCKFSHPGYSFPSSICKITYDKLYEVLFHGTLKCKSDSSITLKNQSTVSTAKRLASIASTIDNLHNTINGYEIACIWNSKYNVHVCMIQSKQMLILYFKNLLFLFLADFKLQKI